MIRSLEIRLAAPTGAKLTQSACSLLHGVLMEHIDSTYAELCINRACVRIASIFILIRNVTVFTGA